MQLNKRVNVAKSEILLKDKNLTKLQKMSERRKFW